MKKAIFLCVLLLFAVLPLFSFVDSYGFLKENETYCALVQALRHDGDEEEGMRLYAELKEMEPEGYTTEQTVALQCKAATSLARYQVMEAQPKNTENAKAILLDALEKARKLEKETFFRLTLEADIQSVRFLADMGDLGSGIASNSALNKAFKLFPDEYYAVFLKANTQLFAPGIYGGNTREGCNRMIELYTGIGSEIARWDYASLLSCIGIACYKLKDYENAKGYLTAAKTLYPVDSQVDEYLAKKELKK